MPKVSRTPSPRTATAGITSARRRVERAVERLDLQHLRQVALVVLEDEGHRRRVQVVGEQVLRHLPVALDVLLPAVEGGVRDEHERVGALQHQPAGGRVHGLAGNREDLQAQVEAAEAGRLEGEQVEEDRAVLGGVDRDQLPAALRVGAAVQDLQVGGLPPDRRAVVDQLDLDRPVAVIQLDHGGPGVAGEASVPARGAAVMRLGRLRAAHGGEFTPPECAGPGGAPQHPQIREGPW